MNGTKPTLTSTGVWGSLAAVAGSALPLFLSKLHMTPDDVQATIAVLGQFAALTGGVVALIGRLRATKILN